jgi:hypothetical protein
MAERSVGGERGVPVVFLVLFPWFFVCTLSSFSLVAGFCGWGVSSSVVRRCFAGAQAAQASSVGLRPFRAFCEQMIGAERSPNFFLTSACFLNVERVRLNRLLRSPSILILEGNCLSNIQLVNESQRVSKAIPCITSLFSVCSGWSISRTPLYRW